VVVEFDEEGEARRMRRNLGPRSARTLQNDSAGQTENEGTQGLSKFPFVELPEFETNGQAVLGQAAVELSILCPVVTIDQLPEWETFVEAQKYWIGESYKISALSASSLDEQGADADDIYYHEGVVQRWLDFDKAQATISLATDMFTMDVESETQAPVNANTNYGGPFLPWWYQTPPPPGVLDEATGIWQVPNVNMDMLSSYPVVSDLYAALTSFTDAPYVISDFVTVPHVLRGKHAYGGRILHHIEDDDEPRSIMLYPVFQKLYNNKLEDGPPLQYDGSRQLAGVLVVTLGWSAFVNDLLSEGFSNVLVVIRNTCGGSASFLLNGSKVSRRIPWFRD
jgi:hypothetical protein